MLPLLIPPHIQKLFEPFKGCSKWYIFKRNLFFPWASNSQHFLLYQFVSLLKTWDRMIQGLWTTFDTISSAFSDSTLRWSPGSNEKGLSKHTSLQDNIVWIGTGPTSLLPAITSFYVSLRGRTSFPRDLEKYSVKWGPTEASAETNLIFDWTGSWTDSGPIVTTTFVGSFMWNLHK